MRFDPSGVGEPRCPNRRTHVGIEQDAQRARPNEPSRGVYGLSPFLRLPYFDMVHMTNLDMMHINFGVVSRHLIQMICGSRLADSVAAEKIRSAKADASYSKAKSKWDSDVEYNKKYASYELRLSVWKKQQAKGMNAIKKSSKKYQDAASAPIPAPPDREAPPLEPAVSFLLHQIGSLWYILCFLPHFDPLCSLLTHFFLSLTSFISSFVGGYF